MIGKTVIGKSFAGCVRYNLEKVNKGQGEILECRGVRDIDQATTIRDFNSRKILRPNLTRCVWHTSISFQDQLSNQQMLTVAKAWMKEMGLLETQYMVLTHYDTNHRHVHIVANRINDNGYTIADNNNWRRSENACKKIIKQFQLTPVPEERNESKINRDKLKGRDGRDLLKTDINRLILDVIRNSKDLNDFADRMNQKGIKCELRYNPDGSIRGIRFERGGVKIKASDINRAYSAINLVKLIEKRAQTLDKKINLSTSDKPTQSQSIFINPSSAKKLFDQEDEEEKKKKKNRDHGYSY